MDSRQENDFSLSRRQFIARGVTGIGGIALASLLNPGLLLGDKAAGKRAGDLDLSHFAPRAKRVIYLCQSGAPSQLDLFDYKPNLAGRFGGDLPDSVRMGQRLTGMTAGQERFPIVPSIFKFKRRGASGAWVSDLLPFTSRITDDLCFVKSMRTQAINHDPAITFLQTGTQQAGRPSFGAWLS